MYREQLIDNNIMHIHFRVIIIFAALVGVISQLQYRRFAPLYAQVYPIEAGTIHHTGD